MNALLIASAMILAPGAYADMWNSSGSLQQESLEDNDLNVGPSDGELFDLETQWDYVDRLDRRMDTVFGETMENLLRPIAAKSTPKMNVVIEIDRGAGQFMNVYVYENDVLKKKYLHWPVSTGLPGRGTTPKGTFRPFEMNAKYFSRKFKVILPYGIKFQGGNLIHAASAGGMVYLGKKRSHGCVRLSPAHAKLLYGLVKDAGMKNTKVVVKDKVERVKPTVTAKAKTENTKPSETPSAKNEQNVTTEKKTDDKPTDNKSAGTSANDKAKTKNKTTTTETSTKTSKGAKPPIGAAESKSVSQL